MVGSVYNALSMRRVFGVFVLTYFIQEVTGWLSDGTGGETPLLLPHLTEKRTTQLQETKIKSIRIPQAILFHMNNNDRFGSKVKREQGYSIFSEHKQDGKQFLAFIHPSILLSNNPPLHPRHEQLRRQTQPRVIAGERLKSNI